VETPTRSRGCVLLVAASGYGKTTALEAGCADGSTTYLTAPTLTDGDSWRLRALGAGGHLAVDDVCALPAPAQVRLLGHLGSLPAGVTLTLAYRRPPGTAIRAALPRQIIERGPDDLALRADDVARVLRDEHGYLDIDLAHLVHDLTAGWPALVHLAGQALAREGAGRRDLLAALTEPGTAGHRWLQEHVLADLPTSVARVLDEIAVLDPITAPLCAALAGGGTDTTSDGQDWLARAGLLTPVAGWRSPGTPTRYRTVPLVAAVLDQQRSSGQRPRGQRPRGQRPGSPEGDPRQDRLRLAADWYAANGFPLAAASASFGAGDPAGCAALIERRGDQMLAAGGAAEVIRMGRQLPVAVRSPETQLILADALRLVGDVTGAEREFGSLLVEAEQAGRLGARLIWRAATLHYLRAEYPAALTLLDKVPPPAVPSLDDVLLDVCRAAVLAALGEHVRAAAAAAAALAGATEDRGRAAAELAAAITADGVGRSIHLRRALAAAERCGDVVTEVRILANQADVLLREARYPQALAAADRAIRAAEQAGPLGILSVALYNAGAALTRLGRYDEAILRLERSTRVAERAGPGRVAAGLCGLGEVNRELGRREQGRMDLQTAADLARACGDLQVLVPSLAGLTRLLLEGPDPDLVAARAAATEAGRVAPLPLRSTALTAQGWVALFDGDVTRARSLAAEAGQVARAGRQTDLLAESLELTAAVSTDPTESRTALQEAASIWHRAGAEPAADRVLVLLGRIPGSDGTHRLAARSAGARLLARGVEVVGGGELMTRDAVGSSVRVSVLGGFEVAADGQHVALPAWRSRQARTLLKILVARRGRPIARTELCEILWPDDEPTRTAHRLSVLLSAVRNVLDSAHRWPADHYLRADVVGVRLDYSWVTVDAEELLRDAVQGGRLARTGDQDRARELLAEADAAYAGDAFSDEPYEDWADAFREEVRAGWLQALRGLVELLRSAGELDRAASALVRLLGADPYDEWAHRTFVELLQSAGRRGEARRAFDRWVEAMRSIDAPTPGPDVLTA
jgi:DNA-binding SARP family transcriptional activator/ATP/maltotriose-dependent transcriptional regulator MalT